MWDDPESQIKPELGPNEQLLWAGRPRLGYVLHAADFFLIPFSLLWSGFAVFWETTVILGGAPFFKLWGIPFVLIGLYLIFGRFFFDALRRLKTFYAVTNERVLILSGISRRSIKSLNIDTLADVSLTEKGDGSGSIMFGPVNPWYGWFGGASWPGSHSPSSLELIDNARTVFETIRKAQRDARIHN